MSSELHVLARRLDRISEQHRWSRDFTASSLHLALGEVIACFPVYRTYAQADTDDDRRRRSAPRPARGARGQAAQPGDQRVDLRLPLRPLAAARSRGDLGRRPRRSARAGDAPPAAHRPGDGQGARGHRLLPLLPARLAERGRRTAADRPHRDRSLSRLLRAPRRALAARALGHRHPRHQAGRGHARAPRRPLRDPARVDGGRQALAADEPPREAPGRRRARPRRPTRSTCSTRRCSASGRSRRSTASCRRRRTARSRSG